MRKTITVIISLFILLCVPSCIREESFDNSQAGNLEALWRIMDEHYCFFKEKKAQLGVDWDEVHTRYSLQATAPLNRYQAFELMSSMLGELQDGHVNLSSAFDIGRSWSWHENYPSNFSDSLQRITLGTDYRIACGLKYRKLSDNSGYLYCGTFENPLGNGNLDEIIYYLASCDKLIIDVRNNGGGMVTAAEMLASRFTEEDVHVGYICHKTGKGHDDFSEPKKQILSPASGFRWHKPVIVLANRSVFSAANEFVKYMKAIGRNNARKGRATIVTVIGDKTGGGAGMPFSSELPNGWSVRFSACPMYDESGQCVEFGIEPDEKVDITADDYKKGIDTILEVARKKR